MLTPVVNITIGTLKFKGCKSFEVDKDVGNLSVTGQVELPLRGMLKGKKGREYIMIGDSIKIGDKITIKAGYLEHEIHEIFAGYVRNIDPSDSIKIAVEDSVYLLRKKPIIINAEKITVKDICNAIITDAHILKLDKETAQLIVENYKGLSLSKNIINAQIDSFKYKGNAAGALAKLKDSMKLTCYFDGSQLFVGGQQMNPKAQVNITYGRNILKNDTSYQYAETTPVLVNVIGKKENGEEVKVVAGTEGGSVMTFYKYNITDKAFLKKIAKEKHKSYSFDGFKGTVKLWFMPFVEPGGSVNYKNENYKQEIEGKYFVKGVKYTFSTSDGLKQTATLGAKL